jgi:hypothetical protein
MLTKVIPLTTTLTEDENLPFDNVSSIRGANTLFQGGEQKKRDRLKKPIRHEK